MQIVTDSGMDMFLPPELMPDFQVHVVRHPITLDGKTYLSGDTIDAAGLQELLLRTASFPITSQPSAGDFAAKYRELAKTDPDILSIQMSSGLSGTYNSALAGAEMVPEANVTVVDTKTLCAALGWQVAAAARALKAGWSKEKIVELVHKIGDVSDSIYTIDDLKYLIHGGRISHMKGLLASLLKIRPIIGVEKVEGKYAQMGMARTFDQALQKLVDLMLKKYAPGTELRVQVLHSYHPEAAQRLTDKIKPHFKCDWMPINLMSPVLSAHTGPTMVGVAFAPQSVFAGLP